LAKLLRKQGVQSIVPHTAIHTTSITANSIKSKWVCHTCRLWTGHGWPAIWNATYDAWNISGLSSGLTVSRYSA